ncbi:hypothetical protein FHG64_03050 [Antarcticibacterium flavum]|uniref:Pyrroline-5-carboxylate reductase catalytic N-terminal domain-containing protein n=1 Tax=Antarcticibacterium flavum TaxID=2058175 RepID=A0A5B7X199_9FLAO|nr:MULTISPECIES: hypothetical protein [Antarcticibacterium]MCM4161235.1 hypothetical protein [Antarcticibacterium sp. W02-3]QCY68448.1 hypothetical protein FHG64_03050 [Antarcticibacterium flavum]
MKAERTIAIIGDTGNFCPALAKQLAGKNVRLLFVSNDEEKELALKNRLDSANPPAEVDFTTCEKEGCWEADVIAFTHPETIEQGLIEKIKEVATQKIVLILSHEEDCPILKDKVNFEELLPHSMVVKVVLNIEKMQVGLLGNDEGSLLTVRGFFEEAGYTLKK